MSLSQAELQKLLSAPHKIPSLEDRISYPKVQHVRALVVRRGDTNGFNYADHTHATVIEVNQYNFELTTTQLDELIHRLVARRMEIAAHDAQCTEKDS